MHRDPKSVSFRESFDAELLQPVGKAAVREADFLRYLNSGP